jgi:hypothetical protein
MNTHKTFSLLAAAIVVAGQAALFAVDTHSTTQDQSRDSYENRYEAKAIQGNAAYATTQNASTIRGA